MTEHTETQKLTLEERLQIQEWLMRAVLWGPYLDDPIDRTKISELLNKCVESAERNKSLPPHVLRELRIQADELLGIDGMPEHLRSVLKH